MVSAKTGTAQRGRLPAGNRLCGCHRPRQGPGCIGAETLHESLRHVRGLVSHASSEEGAQTSSTPAWLDIGGNVLQAVQYAALLFYAIKLAPNQTEMRDQCVTPFVCERICLYAALSKLVGDAGHLTAPYMLTAALNIDGNPGELNNIFVGIFYLMGIHPAIFASLMIPSARSTNKIPVWPFVSLSFATGIFALWPYFILWRPTTEVQSPPPQEELRSSFGRFAMRALESKWLPALNLVSALGCIYYACSEGWTGLALYAAFFQESKFIHVTTIDFALLCLFTPYFMNWDATRRGWASRGIGVPLLSLLPVVGPCIYLLMRPSTQLRKEQS